MPKYKYKTRLLKDIAYTELENVLNYLVLDGGRIVAFEHHYMGPGTILVVIEYEMNG